MARGMATAAAPARAALTTEMATQGRLRAHAQALHCVLRNRTVRPLRPHLVALLLVAAVHLAGVDAALNNALSEVRFGLLTWPSTGSVVLIAIDPRSIRANGSWPWSRTVHAALVEQMEQGVAFDVADQAFTAALRSAGGSVILSAFKQRVRLGDKSAPFVDGPLPRFSENSWPALVNVALGLNGCITPIPTATASMANCSRDGAVAAR